MNLVKTCGSTRSWLGALVAVGLLSGVSAAGEGRSRNLVRNPGFEVGEGGLEYWQARGGATAPLGAHPWSQFRSGRMPGGARLGQFLGGVLLEGVTRYRLSAMFRAEVATRGRLEVVWGQAPSQRRVISGALRGSEWTLVAGTVTLPAGAQPTLWVRADATTRVDEVSLEALGEVGNFPQGHPIPQSFRGMDGGNRALADYSQFPLNNEYKTSYCEDLARTYPDHTVIKQIAFGTIIPRADQARVYPGHWLYFRAVPVVGPVAPTGNTFELRVSDPTRLRAFTRDGTQRFPEVAVVARHANGRPDFSRALHLKLERQVRPGVFATRVLHHYPTGDPRPTFSAGQALCLPHVPWRGSESWLLNLDPAGPRGPSGGGAIDHYAGWIANLVRGLSGVQFDLPYWHQDRVANHQVDIDNDGVGDAGFKGGVNVYGLGQQRFARALRQRLGAAPLINFDGEPDKIRSWSHHDGIQIERFLFRHFEAANPRSDEYLRDRFGFQFDHLRNTVSRLDTLRSYSYGQSFCDSSTFTNTASGGIARDRPGAGDTLLRAGLASNVLLGLIHSYTERDRDWARSSTSETDPFWPVWLDEYEDAGRAGWLGRARTPLAQRTTGLTPLAPISDWSFSLSTASGYRARLRGGSDAQRSYEVSVEATPAGRPQPSGVRLVSQPLPLRRSGQLYTLVFEARGDTDWSYAGQTFHSIPRALQVGGLNALSSPSTKVFVGRVWRMYTLTFRAASDTSGRLSFGASEQVGSIELRKVRLFAGSANRFLRLYEGGAVALNMSNAAWEAPLPSAPRRKVPADPSAVLPLDRVRVPAWDAVFLAD